ncbi:hypothetical protein MP228_008613 [Amoeboaphelidium protococcarum]|nr:hypothetical protein MP228_008613 [Amoeboaphelidium protococcarum]
MAMRRSADSILARRNSMHQYSSRIPTVGHTSTTQSSSSNNNQSISSPSVNDLPDYRQQFASLSTDSLSDGSMHPLSNYSSAGVSAQDLTSQSSNSIVTGSSKHSGQPSFVQKLYTMVSDNQNTQLISWSPTGTSFVVVNATDFARDVLPKYFKHKNFQSFQRQLNMYGFHKANKSNRGQRSSVDQQFWEFCHPKFLRGHIELLDDIKRRTVESDVYKKETSEIQKYLVSMQNMMSDHTQTMYHIQKTLVALNQELHHLKRRQTIQDEIIRQLYDQTLTLDGQDAQPSADQQPMSFDSLMQKLNSQQLQQQQSVQPQNSQNLKRHQMMEVIEESPANSPARPRIQSSPEYSIQSTGFVQIHPLPARSSTEEMLASQTLGSQAIEMDQLDSDMGISLDNLIDEEQRLHPELLQNNYSGIDQQLQQAHYLQALASYQQVQQQLQEVSTGHKALDATSEVSSKTQVPQQQASQSADKFQGFYRSA